MDYKGQDKKERFMMLYRQYHRQLNAYCTALANNRDDAEDLMSATIEIAYTKFDELRDEGKFKYYLFGIASRLTNNERRKMNAKIFITADHLANFKDLHTNADETIDHYYLYKALQKLNNETRDAIVLFELQGFSIKEIAEMQNTNENTVKTRLLRGREKLKELLNPDIKTTKPEVKYGTR